MRGAVKTAGLEALICVVHLRRRYLSAVSSDDQTTEYARGQQSQTTTLCVCASSRTSQSSEIWWRMPRILRRRCGWHLSRGPRTCWKRLGSSKRRWSRGCWIPTVRLSPTRWMPLLHFVEEERAAPSSTHGRMQTSTRQSSITTRWLVTFTSQICGSS